jgi:ADP-heptose:LPS heptosyltransferase
MDHSEARKAAQQAARACLRAPRHTDEAALLLAEMALSREAEIARIGTEAIFRGVVEPLGDAFERRLADWYTQFFARVAQHARSAAGWFDRRLRDFGLETEEDLVERVERLRRRGRPAGRPGQILVLSRVTLGADIAATSVVLRHLLNVYPEARIRLLGSAKAAELFAGEPRVESRAIDYPRGGTLLERLEAWERLVEAIEEEATPDCWVVDPDSRLTQLGMLPVLREEARYWWFESRAFERPGRETLAELAAAWAEETFGEGPQPAYPWVSLEPRAEPAAEGRWAAVNLGVGDNPRKRLEGAFEERLLAGLREAGWKIFLDTGDGGEETARVEGLAERLGPNSIRLYRGSLAGFGGLVAQSQLYVGYDSAGQHLAAALGTPVIDIFAGYSSPRMVERWRPTGEAPVTMVVVRPEGAEVEEVLGRVLEAAR